MRIFPNKSSLYELMLKDIDITIPAKSIYFILTHFKVVQSTKTRLTPSRFHANCKELGHSYSWGDKMAKQPADCGLCPT